MTKIYENDERNKLLPILITINFISRTSWPMFLFVIKRKVANLEFDISIYESYISIIRHWRRLCIWGVGQGNNRGWNHNCNKKNLKRKKSHGVDGLLNEYFIEFKDFLMPTLLRVFNGILQLGIFSTAWAVAVLVPIFKRGNPEDPNNCRGISLVSNFGKLFTSVLNQRL